MPKYRIKRYIANTKGKEKNRSRNKAFQSQGKIHGARPEKRNRGR